MTRRSAYHAVALATFVLLLATLPAKASTCSQAALGGRWSYTYTGTIYVATSTGPVPLPVASVGHYRQDSSGNIQGGQARSVAGSSGFEDITGTITVHDDCTATGAIDVLVGGQLQRSAVLALVYNQDANHFRAIFQSLVLPDGTNLPVVITIEGEREHTRD